MQPHSETITILANYPQPIVLIGLMGAGKSTIGRRLAKQLNRDFIDSDEEIEQAAACSISDIFAVHGEAIFRDLERRVIGRLLDTPNLVLATGGGAWIQPPVRQLIKEKHAVSVWLSADLETLVQRVEKRNHRPLLESGDKNEILRRLMQDRYPIYAEADLTIESAHGPHEIVVEKVMEALLHHWQVQHV